MARDPTVAIAVGLSLANAALVQAAGLAITALAFAVEHYVNIDDKIAAVQTEQAKRALIDAVAMAKRATDAGNELLEARLSASTGGAP